MGKKVREYKSGDFIFAKVKGYPAWPARVQRPNGKKYFVYFYGTGETANLPPNMIFDYAENKEKLLSKSVKRRDFNDGVKQIEYDFANNVPLEDVIGVPLEPAAEGPANDTVNDSAIDATLNDTADTTVNDTVDDVNATQNDATVEDSDETGALVIDEGKTPAKGRKSKVEPKPKETPKPKEPKTPRGRAKKEEVKEGKKEEDGEELVSRSGRKIRPKRYIDEQTEENATLPSPAPKRRRGPSPVGEKEKADATKDTGKETDKDRDSEGKSEKSVTQFNVVRQSELEGLREAFKPADEDKENILIAYLPSGAYAGIRLFQSRPRTFKNEAARLQWDKQAARNALTLKMQLEREHITPQSVQGQLVLDLNLTDEEKATLDKERETEEKKSRVNFLKTEMKLIELDAKIKTCLCLEKADTELCLKLLDELLALEVKPLMLLKHPTCLETVKRMRAYVGNTPSWDLNETDALAFSKQAHKIRKKADLLYKNMKEHFQTPEGLSFWEYFSERVLMFKKVTATLNAGELLELVHEPAELSQPNVHTMKAAIEEANKTVPPLPDSPELDEEDEKQAKKKAPAAKSKKPPPTPSKKRTRGSKKEEEPTEEAQKPDENAVSGENTVEENGEKTEKEKGEEEKVTEEAEKDTPAEPDTPAKETNEDIEMAEPEKALKTVDNQTEGEKESDTPDESEARKSKMDKPKDAEKEKSTKKDKKASDKSDSSEKDEEPAKESDKKDKKNSKESKETKNGKESEKSGKDGAKEKEDASDDKSERDEDKDSSEPRAKRSRETKKTEPPPPRSPAKRKSKF